MIELNEQQSSALDALVDFVKDENASMFCLRGYAGTGKSTTIQRLIPRIKASVAFSAPTHKAVRVLKAMAESAGIGGIECCTIHSILGLKVTRVGENEKLRQGNTATVHKFDLVVVDECSMVSNDLLDYIRQANQLHRTKFIFLGDPAQLPPVGEESSPSFAVADSAELTQVMRQRGENPILGLCTDIREQWSAGDYRLPFVSPECSEDGSIGLHVMAGHYFRDYMPSAFALGTFDENPDRFRVIAWQNKTVDVYNDYIQRFRYPGLSTVFAVGEPVTIGRTVKRRACVGFENDWSDDILVYTQTEGVVCGEPEPATHNAAPNLNAWRVRVRLETGAELEVWTLDRRSWAVHEIMVKQMAREVHQKKREWRDYWTLMDSFCFIRSSYAMTAHASQGSTFENVFVDSLDIWQNRNKPEALQCLYVACSRASHHLIMNTGS